MVWVHSKILVVSFFDKWNLISIGRSGRLGFVLRLGFGFEVFNSRCVAGLTGPAHEGCV